VREHRVTGVPKIVVNRAVEILGPVEEDEFVQRIVEGRRLKPEG